MKVSASFFSSKNIPKDLEKLNDTDVDYIHVDIMDGKFVKNKTMPFREMRHIYEYTSKRLDVHLMVEDPSKYIPLYAELNTEYITFHVEVLEDIKKNIDLIKSYSIKAGLAIKPNTKINELIPYLPFIDLILIMSVEPGEGGQAFIEESENRVNEVRELINSYNLDCVINIDGGINNETVKKCNNCDIVVAGSYIINGDNFQDKISSLR
jgi:ribulose-phosphate 3-epimerase